MKFKSVSKYDGLFEKCEMHPNHDGYSVFDQKGRFIGEILDEGFALDTGYEHSDLIHRELTKKGFKVFDYETFYEIKNESEIAELLYG